MVTAIALPVHELLEMKGNKFYGFDLVFYPDVNGADGVMRSTKNDMKPEWIITGPWAAKLPRHAKGEGVTIKHLEVKRDKVIINHSYVYDRVGFIALKADRVTSDEMIAEVIGETLSAKDIFDNVAANSATSILTRNTKIESRAARHARVKSSKASIGNR